MFGRARSHRQRQSKVDRDQQKQDEVALLRTKVARLENALAQALASDPVLDLRSSENDLDQLAAQPIEGFAAAWTGSDTTPEDPAGDKFFASGHVDQRARSWLLAT